MNMSSTLKIVRIKMDVTRALERVRLIKGQVKNQT